MKKYLLALALLPMMVSASAENYFREGTVWNYLGVSGGFVPDNCGIATYSLEGKQTVGGYECSNLYRITDHNPATREFVALVRAEGDKVLFLRSEEDTEWQTLYDFSLTLGESALVTPINAGGWNVTNYVECISEGVAEQYGDFPKINILGKDEVTEETREEWSDRSKNMWLRGVGGAESFDIDVLYDDICGGYGYGTLLNAASNGTTVCQHIGYKDAEPGESVFEDYTMWFSEVFDGDESYIKKEFLMQSVSNDLDGQPRPYILTNFENKVSVEGDVVYRMKPGDSTLKKVVAYDFSMQPGDVREIAPIDGDMEETTWMRCESRKPSTVFPGYDEIFLAEFADEGLTQFLGRGSWIAGIGTVHGVSCNSRFDRSKAKHQMFKVIVNGRVALERSLANLETVKAEGGASAAAVFYNLQGMRVDNPGNGMYIRVEGGKTSKVLLK